MSIEKEHSVNGGLAICSGLGCEYCLETFHGWFYQLRLYLHDKYGWAWSAISTLSSDDWRVYYDEGYTPDMAIQEDTSNA